MNASRIHNFPYDPFQLKAIDSVRNGRSLIVSAPTGAGKTVIAEYVCHQSIQESKGVIYTAPVKALSNQKYRDFTAVYGRERVGILTGDVSINPSADILIMTTEIFRNRLFEPENLFENRSWAIFDEIHYLDDLERGTVWEESLIFFPKGLCMLALSATIPNIEELASWIQSVHGNPVDTVVETRRPVPLSFYFMTENRVYRGFENKFHEAFLRKKKHYAPNRLETLVDHLKRIDGFPAIYFIFSRKRCEVLAGACRKFNLVNASEKKTLEKRYDALCRQFQLEGDPHALEMRPYIRLGIAFHHAGILPPLKEIIERLFTARLIKLIFTTETFALGINMPSKSVIFDDLRKFYGYDFDFLKTRDFFQMAGRAGRRGFDTSGQVFSLVPPRRMPFQRLRRIIEGEPEPVFSQFNTGYATLLNLYAMMQESLTDVYPKSFHHYQSGKKQQKRGMALLRAKLSLLKFLGYIDDGALTGRGRFASRIFGYELEATELFMQGFFEQRNEEEILVMITAMVFEPRKRQRPPPMDRKIRSLKRIADRLHDEIRRAELMFKIDAPRKRFYFHLSSAMIAWSRGIRFEDIHRYTDVHEGEVIRNFRMTLQVLRELRHMRGVSEQYVEKIKNCIRLIKRDLIDPESQFEMG